MDLGLTRKAAAKVLRTNAQSLKHWEEGSKGHVRPMFISAIVAFLGYNPLPEPKTRGEAIRRERLSRGWSIERLGAAAGLDPATVRRMEADRPRLGVRSRQAVYEKLSLRLQR